MTEGRIVIGKDCLLGPGAFVTAWDYSLDAEPTVKSQTTRERDIVIADDVWISAGGSGATATPEARRARAS